MVRNYLVLGRAGARLSPSVFTVEEPDPPFLRTVIPLCSAALFPLFALAYLSKTRHACPTTLCSRAWVAPGLQLGQADGPAPLQRTAEVRWSGRQTPQGAKGWNLLEAAWLASHGPAVLDATLGGDAGPWQEAAEQAVGLAVDSVWDRAGAQVC